MITLINLPAPVNIVHDAGTDFAKRFAFPPLVLGSAWSAEVTITLPSGAGVVCAIGSGLSFADGKLIWSLTSAERLRLAGKPGTLYSISLISPDGVRKCYVKGLLTIQ